MSQFVIEPKNTITIAVSSSALLDLGDDDSRFDEIGYESFYANQFLDQDRIYPTGKLLPFVRSLNFLNNLSESPSFRILLITMNCEMTVKRALNSLSSYGIELDQVITLNGSSISDSLIEHSVDIFFTTREEDVSNNNGIPVVQIDTSSSPVDSNEVLHISFDADGVLFDSASHIHYLMTDLNTFDAYECANQALPLAEGPLMQLANKLSQLKRSHPMFDQLIKLSVVSSRSEKAMSRVISSARYYKLAFDEFIACDGQNKGLVLKNIQAHLFLDDELQNVLNAAHHLPSGRVMATNSDFEHYAA